MANNFIHIDRLLTNFATNYAVKDDVAEFIAPSFKVKRSSDKYAEYSKAAFRIYENAIEGREKAKEIDVDVTSSTYSCQEYELAKFVSNRDRNNADKPIDMERDAVKKLKDAQMLAREKRVYDIAGNNTVVTQTAVPSNKWDVAASGTPVSDIRTGMVTIWQNSTEKANSIAIPNDVATKMIGTEEYRDYFKYSGTAANEQFNIISGLRHLGLEPMLIGVFGVNSNEGGASDPAVEPLWSDSVLIFTRQASPTLATRTFMYSPYVKKDIIQRFDKREERGVKFTIYEDIDELLVDATAAYLLTDTLT